MPNTLSPTHFRTYGTIGDMSPTVHRPPDLERERAARNSAIDLVRTAIGPAIADEESAANALSDSFLAGSPQNSSLDAGGFLRRKSQLVNR